MARKLSPLAIQSALAQETDEAWLFLLEVKHPDLATPYRWVNNTENIVSKGETFEPFPFSLSLSMDEESHLPEVALSIDNVERALVAVSRSSVIAPEFTIRLILASQPDIYEVEIFGLTLLEVSYDAYSFTGTLYADDLLNTRYPADVVSIAGGYQGLFRQ